MEGKDAKLFFCISVVVSALSMAGVFFLDIFAQVLSPPLFDT